MAHNLWEYVNENVDNGNGEKFECVANLPKPTAGVNHRKSFTYFSDIQV